MEDYPNVVGILEEIKTLLGQSKKIMNVEDLAAYTGLSKSKIHKLTSQKLIPMGNNPYIRQKFFEKATIDRWLMGKPILRQRAPKGESQANLKLEFQEGTISHDETVKT